MSEEREISEQEVGELHQKLLREGKRAGYSLNPEVGFTRELIKGLIFNQRRYGYWACPCRLASGKKAEDLDIICPCDYRDADLGEYGACYCALYVAQTVLTGEKNVSPIPERRPSPGRPAQAEKVDAVRTESPLSYPVWRCRVCGYLCAREKPPDACPICSAGAERFERFM
jgi:ferredoxin-thioredoxin reductase catalytic chain